jgi:hypothetical protein
VRPKIYRLRYTREAVDRLVRDRRVQMDTEMHKLEEAAESVKKQFQQLDKTLSKDEVYFGSIR